MATWNFTTEEGREAAKLNKQAAEAMAAYDTAVNLQEQAGKQLNDATKQLNDANLGGLAWSRGDIRRFRKSKRWSKGRMRNFLATGNADNEMSRHDYKNARQTQQVAPGVIGMTKQLMRNRVGELYLNPYAANYAAAQLAVADRATYNDGIDTAAPVVETPDKSKAMLLFDEYEKSLGGRSGTLKGFWDYAREHKANLSSADYGTMINAANDTTFTDDAEKGMDGTWDIKQEDTYGEDNLPVGRWKRNSNQDPNMYLALRKRFYKKFGGTMKYYQQGGAVQQEDQLAPYIEALASDDLKAQMEALNAIALSGLADAIVKEIASRALQGDEKATKAVQFIQTVMEALKKQAVKAANGAKLLYINQLRGVCPEGYKMQYFKAGGKVCSKCIKVLKKACGGKTMKKKENGGAISPFMELYKASRLK